MLVDLQHSPAMILQQLLIQRGVGVDPTILPLGVWPVYFDEEPGQPDQVMTVYDLDARNFGDSQVDGESLDHFGCKVMIRSATHAGGYPQALLVHSTFNQRVRGDSVTIAGSTYIMVSIKARKPLRIGKDTPTSKRRRYTVNCTVALLPSAEVP